MEEIQLLRKKLEREKLARKQAESILESKAAELYEANNALHALNVNLEKEVKNRSKQLAESEEQYRSLVERSADIFFNVDEDGFFSYMNETGLSRFGYKADEIIGSKYVKFVPPEYKDRVYEYYTKLREDKVESDYYEFPILSKDGVQFWMGQNVTLMFDKAGSPYYSAVARDITRRKKTETELKKAQVALSKSEVKYRSVIENMELGLLEVDLDGVIIKSYDRFNEMLGYQKGELEGKIAYDVLTAPGHEEIIRRQEQNRIKGESGVYEMKIKRKDGTSIWVLISGTPYSDESGKIVGTVGIHYDITKRKLLSEQLKIAKEQAVKAQLAEKQFLANMSHEIRTPLNAIIGMSHLMIDTRLDEEQREYLSILSNSANMLKNLISDILDMSKIDAGTLELQSKIFNMSEDIENLVKTFRLKTEEKGVVIRAQVDPKLNRQIVADRQLLNQVLLNLISNAVKFTEKGSIEITVAVTADLVSEYKLLIQVKDTGIGIDDKEAVLIFKDFKQANKEIRTKYGGTGLGLTISKKLLELMDSELRLDSVLGKGSTFYFELLVGKSDLDVNEIKNDKSQKLLEGLEEKMILVVEDNELNVKYLTRLLEKWKLQYHVSGNGEEATNYYRENHADIILMDLQMPVMDGFEATKIIREMNTSKSIVPIIALTASTFLSKKQMAEDAGMTDFLSKPFTPDELSEVLSNYLLLETNEYKKTSDAFVYNKQLDTSYLLMAYDDDVAYASDMFDTFLEIVNDEKEKLKDVLLSKDKDEIGRQLHKMKPIFRMVGVPKISLMIESMESMVSDGSIELLSNEYNNLELKIDGALPVIKQEAERLRLFKNKINE